MKKTEKSSSPSSGIQLLNTIYKPDVLQCLANLSNDEVFTPPQVVNEVLDLLPEELWSNPDVTFLDPVSKTGIFLREIAKRLLKGLEPEIPDLQERINHILKKQLFGIAITELTGLLSRRSVYCSKNCTNKWSIAEFQEKDGNICFSPIKHTWKNGKCTFCGASQAEYERSVHLETHAYLFIHQSIEKIFGDNMKFDVIVGNPPYQLETGGVGRQATPLYHLFVEQAKKLNPRFLTMIIPSRWFSGGFGLDTFREHMLNDDQIRKIVDFPNSHDVFSGVDVPGGICYFLWEKDSHGPCEITNISGEKKYSQTRSLNEFSTFVRSSQAIPIIRKVLSKERNCKTLANTVSPQRPFGLPTNYSARESGIPCFFIQKIGKKFASKSDVSDKNNLLNKWKLLVPKAPIAGQTDFTQPVGFYYNGNTRIAEPGECCTESWIVAGSFETKEEVDSFKTYLFTKTVRFLLLQAVVSQDVLRNKFCFVPALPKYEGKYTDAELCQRWGITPDEWSYIDSKITAVEA